MTQFLTRLFCEHEFKLVHSYLYDVGRNKMFVYRCAKCGKVKQENLY